MKKLILIRHGETEYTKTRRYCGHEDIPLNAKGIKQAKRLSGKLKSMRVDRIYSSDLKRALETAKIAFPKKTILKKKRLREIDFGEFSGLTFEEAKRIYPRSYKTWLNDPAKSRIPKGESMSILKNRVEACFKIIFGQNPKKTIALVSHGGPIRIILLKILGQNLDKFWNIKQDTATINVIEFKKNGPRWVNSSLS